MSANELSLTFLLKMDGGQSVAAEFQRLTAQISSQLAGLNKPNDGAAAASIAVQKQQANSLVQMQNQVSKATIDSQREVERQIEAMWTAREKEQAASVKKQSDIDRGFAAQQISIAQNVENEIAAAYKDRETELAKTAKQELDLWSKHEAGKLATTRQAEKEGEAAVVASQAAKDKAAKTSAENFLKTQRQISADVAKANAQTAANQIRAALVAAKGTADISSIASKGIESLSDHLNLFIGHRIPLAGGAFIRLTENVRGFITLSKESEGSVLRLGNLIADLSLKTGKSAPEIKDFLGSFSKLGSQVEKDEAAVSAFGPALAQKLIPQLAAADSEMTALAASTGEVGGAFAALTGPVGIAILAVAAVVTVLALAEKKLFDVAKASAEVEGKFVDLSQQTGLSTEFLSAFDMLAATTGTDLGSLSASFGIFQKHLEDAQDPMSASAGLLGELGIQTTDTETALRQTFATLAKMPEGFRQTALALQLFGRGGKSVLAIIKETNGDIDAAIKKLRDLGLIVSLEDAKAADKFNDELELLNRQVEDLTVELGKEFLPAAIDIVHTLSDLAKASHGIFDTIGIIGRPTIEAFASSLRGLALVLAAVRHDAELTKAILDELADRRNIKPIELPKEFPGVLTPVPLLTGEESALKKAGEEARLVRAEVNEAVRFAESQLAAIDRQLQLRELSPAEALEPIIALEKAKTEAAIKGLEDDRERKAKERTENEKERQQQAKDIQAFDEQIANERAKFDKFEADKRAEFRAQELQREQAHRRALADLFVSALNDRIAAVNRAAQAGTNSELFAQDVTTELLKAGFAKRKEILERERVEAGKDPALVQQVNAQLADLQRERTATLSEQANRRIQIIREEARKQLELERSTIDSLLRASAITDASRIATIKSLAALRVKTEEQAAREILQIRLDAIDRERSLAVAEREVVDQQIDARLKGFKTQRQKLEAELNKLPPLDKRRLPIAAELQANLDAEIDAQKKANKDKTDADTDLNNKLRVLDAQRSQIKADGNRDIDEKRKEDLTNERKYADDLKEIQREIADALRDNQQLIIDLMIEHNARRVDILAARVALQRTDEDARHKRVTDAIGKERVENAESNRTLEEKNAKTAELNRRAEVEEERHRLEKRRIHDAETRELERLDPTSNRSLFGDAFAENLARIREEAELSGESINSLSAKFQAAAVTAADFFRVQSEEAGNFATIAGGAIASFTEGLGQMLSAWVLTGDTGPAALRKLTAQVLAQVAAQAAVKAIFELAEGFALLFVDPPASASHFTAAAIFGSVAGVAAIAGRGLAGNLFKQPSTSTTRGTNTQTGPSTELNPVTLGRNQPQAQIPKVDLHVHVTRDEGSAVKAWVDNYKRGGIVREMTLNDA